MTPESRLDGAGQQYPPPHARLHPAEQLQAKQLGWALRAPLTSASLSPKETMYRVAAKRGSTASPGKFWVWLDSPPPRSMWAPGGCWSPALPGLDPGSGRLVQPHPSGPDAPAAGQCPGLCLRGAGPAWGSGPSRPVQNVCCPLASCASFLLVQGLLESSRGFKAKLRGCE